MVAWGATVIAMVLGAVAAVFLLFVRRAKNSKHSEGEGRGEDGKQDKEVTFGAFPRPPHGANTPTDWRARGRQQAPNGATGGQKAPRGVTGADSGTLAPSLPSSSSSGSASTLSPNEDSNGVLTFDGFTRPPLGIRVVCVSDTHGKHRNVDVPPGDVLVHAGDWTHFGKRNDADDLNTWLGELAADRALGFQHIVVVNGNHECNAGWKREAASILSNATLLIDEHRTLQVRAGGRDNAASASASDSAQGNVVELKIHGTQFFWPMTTRNPHYALVPPSTDVLVCHGPCRGMADGGGGCDELLKLAQRRRPRLVVSGHVHGAHGSARNADTLFVNAACCGSGVYAIRQQATVVDL
jgi:predicted phosphodiesterase